MGHEGVIEEEYRTDENSAARRNIATDDIDRAPSAETKPLVVVPKAFHTGRFDKGEGGNESPGRVAMGYRDGHYIASFPSPSAAITAAVEIISSPGQASRPNRLQRPARAPPTVEETNDHGGKRLMSTRYLAESFDSNTARPALTHRAKLEKWRGPRLALRVVRLTLLNSPQDARTPSVLAAALRWALRCVIAPEGPPRLEVRPYIIKRRTGGGFPRLVEVEAGRWEHPTKEAAAIAITEPRGRDITSIAPLTPSGEVLANSGGTGAFFPLLVAEAYPTTACLCPRRALLRWQR